MYWNVEVRMRLFVKEGEPELEDLDDDLRYELEGIESDAEDHTGDDFRYEIVEVELIGGEPEWARSDGGFISPSVKGSDPVDTGMRDTSDIPL